MIRVLAEKLSRQRILKRRLPSRFSSTPLYVSPDSQLKYLKLGSGAFDQDLLTIADQYINEYSQVWDIGANVGVFAFAAASLAKRGAVLAVEADIWLAQLMKKSLALKKNNKLNLKILPSAISDQCGVATFFISKRGRALNSLKIVGGGIIEGIRDEVVVPTLTLDSLLDFFHAPSFIKIDVEGAEAYVLRGSRKILEYIRPVIYIEVCSEANEEVMAIFNEWNYILFDGSKNIEEQEPLSVCKFNTLAIPREKQGECPLNFNHP